MIGEEQFEDLYAEPASSVVEQLMDLYGKQQWLLSPDDPMASPMMIAGLYPQFVLTRLYYTLDAAESQQPAIDWWALRSELLTAQSFGEEPLVRTFLSHFLLWGSQHRWDELLEACRRFGSVEGISRAANLSRSALQQINGIHPDVFIAGFLKALNDMGSAMPRPTSSQDRSDEVVREHVAYLRRCRLDLMTAGERDRFMRLAVTVGRVLQDGRLRHTPEVRRDESDAVDGFVEYVKRIVAGWIGTEDGAPDPVLEEMNVN